jgi:hypothetical protein
LVQNAAGSSGVVSLEFNQDKTVLVGAAFGQGQVDVWDVSAPDGTLKVIISASPPLPHSVSRRQGQIPACGIIEPPPDKHTAPQADSCRWHPGPCRGTPGQPS